MIKFTEEEKKEIKGRLLSFLSRKFILAIVILIISSVLVVKGDLSADTWLTIVAGEILGYQFSNALSKNRK